MGTRNLTMVIKDGQPRIAQYGQWDGYPEGQGVNTLTFLRTANLERFKSQLDKCHLSKEVSEDSVFDSRDHGAGILSLVNEVEMDEIPLYDSSGFAEDSLFCEWAYVIDLDKNVLEVYEGFNKSPLAETERFFYLQKENGDNGYYPIKHVTSFPLSELPTNEDFVSRIKSHSVEV